MEYTEALEKLSEMTRFGINLGLQRITSLLKQFAHPEDRIPIIHIGGTNGKGSTLALLSSILREAGYRVGAYTSPHLVSYRERFMINGEMIPTERFTALLEEILAAVGEVQRETGENPTEFEVLTALAFLYFARERVDIALIEVGLGGDIDSTNVVKKPVLSIITNVSLEHTAYLGTTLTEIARHKSGIIKEGCPVLTASREEEVLKVLRERAADCRAPLGEIYTETKTQWTAQEKAERRKKLGKEKAQQIQEIQAQGGQFFSVKTPCANYRELFIPLWGEHQIANAVLAIRAAELLQGQGWRIDEDAIHRGLAKAQWPGRLEVIGTNPLRVIDGAHNPAGMAALAYWLEDIRGKGWNKGKIKRVILVIGMLDDKDRLQAAGLISPLVDVIIVTKPQSERARDWAELKQYFGSAKPLFVIEDLEQALIKARQEATDPLDLILVTGSLYLIGEVKKLAF